MENGGDNFFEEIGIDMGKLVVDGFHCLCEAIHVAELDFFAYFELLGFSFGLILVKLQQFLMKFLIQPIIMQER